MVAGFDPVVKSCDMSDISDITARSSLAPEALGTRSCAARAARPRPRPHRGIAAVGRGAVDIARARRLLEVFVVFRTRPKKTARARVPCSRTEPGRRESMSSSEGPQLCTFDEASRANSIAASAQTRPCIASRCPRNLAARPGPRPPPGAVRSAYTMAAGELDSDFDDVLDGEGVEGIVAPRSLLRSRSAS